MKKLFKTFSFMIAGLMAWFSPMQSIQHGQGMCCAECAMKKPDEVEMVEEKEEEDDTESN